MVQGTGIPFYIVTGMYCLKEDIFHVALSQAGQEGIVAW